MKVIKNSFGVFVGFLLTILSLIFTGYQVMQANEQLLFQEKSARWQNYNLLNDRYANHLMQIPVSISTNDKGSFSDLTEKDKLWVRSYLDLTSEEFWLKENDLLPEEIWETRIVLGIKNNFITFPKLQLGYQFYKNETPLYYSKKYTNEIDNIISRIKKR